jgi:hypothetical protein
MIDDAPPLRPRRREPDANGILVRSPYPLSTLAIGIGAVLLLTVVGFFLGTVDIGMATTTRSVPCRRSSSPSWSPG